MSRSASPSITQFFKSQRKRPRTGKDDGVPMTASKKLLLEDGIVKCDSGKIKRDKPTPVETVLVVVETPRNERKANSETVQSTAPQKEVGKQQATGSGSPVKFLKVASLSPSKKKKMTTEQVAKLLRKKTKLSDLKSALEGINQCAQKLNEFRRTVAEANAKASPAKKGEEGKDQLSVQGISPAKFYSPTADRVNADLARLSATKLSSPSKLVNINNKIKKRLFDEQTSESERDKGTVAPAYERFHNLAQKTPAEKGVSDGEADLPLPYKFKVLKELFVAVETVLGIMKGRKELITFPKLKAGVLELVRKVSLREKHLAQMVAVLPGCYTFDLEKVGLEYHIRINVEDLPPSVVCARRRTFHSNLIKTCLEHHKTFLLALVPPIVVPADKQITRWHPSFKIDEIPDIMPQENVLPAKPVPDKLSTAREVLAKAQHILENANPRMKMAVKNMINNVETDERQNSTVAAVQPKTKSAATIKNLKGVSQSLLEKIRNREREKLLKEMTRTPAESKKLQMMKRLPNFIKIIRNMMVADKKVALPMETVIDRISHSIQGMAKGDADAHIRLMVTVLPHWSKIHKLSHSDMEYLRIEKATDINDLLQEMDDIIKKNSS